jgi:ribosome maturation factor RimP
MKRQDLDQIIEPVVGALGLEFLGIEFVPGRRSSLLRVYIDAPGRHVAVEDCEAVSRQLGAVLDVEDPIAGAFDLEVSSPGFDRPLFTPAHFARFAGQSTKIQTSLPIGGRRRFQGPIAAVDDEAVTVVQDGTEVRIAHANIQRANLVPDYSAYDAQPKGGRARPGRGAGQPKPKPKAEARPKADAKPKAEARAKPKARSEANENTQTGRRGSATGRKP